MSGYGSVCVCVYTFHACELLFTKQWCQSMTSILGGETVQSSKEAGRGSHVLQPAAVLSC